MVGPRQEVEAVWGKDPWVQLQILALPATWLGQTRTSLNLTFLVYKKRIIMPDSRGDYNEYLTSNMEEHVGNSKESYKGGFLRLPSLNIPEHACPASAHLLQCSLVPLTFNPCHGECASRTPSHVSLLPTK